MTRVIFNLYYTLSFRVIAARCVTVINLTHKMEIASDRSVSVVYGTVVTDT